MHVLERKIAEHEPCAAAEALEQQLHGRLRLFAVGALEVAVLDDSHRGVRGADHVIDGTDGCGELKRFVRRHRDTPGDES